MAVLLAHLKVKDGKEDYFEAIQKGLWEQTWKHEPGVVRYEHYRGKEKGRYYAILGFRDFAGFIRHQTAEYHESPDWENIFDEVVLEWLDPIQGSNDLKPSLEQDLGDDLTERERYYVTRTLLTREAWWPKV
ncbi:MAG: putative quinol monooxygenase [Sphingomonadales bacterium]